MEVMWCIVSTLVYIVAIFIAIEFCYGRIKKYSKRDEEEEAAPAARRASAPAKPTWDAREGATAAETTGEIEAVVEEPPSHEDRVPTGPADAGDTPEASPERQVEIDVHKEPVIPEKVIPEPVIPEKVTPEPAMSEEVTPEFEEPAHTPEDVRVKEVAHAHDDAEAAAQETVPKEPEQLVEPEVDQDEPEAAVAATKIQAGFRGHKSRKRVKKMKEEKDAATKIQAGFRGWKSRKQVSVKRRDPPGLEAEADDHVTEESPTAVTEEKSSLSMPSDVMQQHVAKETASGLEPPETFADKGSPVEELSPEVPSPVVESAARVVLSKQPDVVPPTPEVTQPDVASTPSPSEGESPVTSSPEEIPAAPFSEEFPPAPPPTPATVEPAGGTEATEPRPVILPQPDSPTEGGLILAEVKPHVSTVAPAIVQAVTDTALPGDAQEKQDVLEKETVEVSEKVLHQPSQEVESAFKVEKEPAVHQMPGEAVTVVEKKTLTKQESEVYPYVEETVPSEEFDPESLIAQAVSRSTPEVVMTSERTVSEETGPDGKTQTIVKVEHTVVREITKVVTPKTSEVVTTEERTATSVSSDERSSEEQVTVVEASDDDAFEESGLEPDRRSGPKDKGTELDRNSASFTDKWEPEPGES